MEKPQVIMAEFQHETNCFSPTKAGRREFEERILIDSEEIIPFYKGTKTVVGGFIKASEVEAFEIMPVIAACAEPCGLITKDMFEFVKNKIIRAIDEVKNLGGVLLCLHGAMVSEAGIATLPGTHFGKYGDGYLRLSYATSQENIKKGLERINTAIGKIAA